MKTQIRKTKGSIVRPQTVQVRQDGAPQVGGEAWEGEAMRRVVGYGGVQLGLGLGRGCATVDGQRGSGIWDEGDVGEGVGDRGLEFRRGRGRGGGCTGHFEPDLISNDDDDDDALRRR